MTTARRLLAGVLILALIAGILLWTPDRDRAELEALYLNKDADMVALLGTPVHLRDDGPREQHAVVMLHGLGASLHTWEPWAQSLAQDVRIIRFDMPGAGLSPPDTSNIYSDERMIDLLLALMEEKGLTTIDLVGHSMGGRIAWRFAAAQPDRLRRLVLIAPDGFASPGFEYDRAPEVPLLMEAMRFFLPAFLFEANLEASYANPGRLTDQTVQRYYDLVLAPGNRAALLERTRQTRLRPPPPILKTISAYTLLIWGEMDAMIPFSNAEDYLAHLPNAGLVSFPGLGHVPHEEAPDKVLAAVAAFLKAPVANDEPATLRLQAR
ncbi:MAG: alpha/beta hydrolase [Pseudomonadota bacterium]